MISIVIPTKNEAKYLPKLLASIRLQSVQPAEVIVADAKSTDNTRAIAESYGARVVEGGMPGAGRNRGAEAATSEYLLFLDADVELVDKDFLKKALAEMDERHLDFATCKIVPMSDKLTDKIGHDFYNVFSRLAKPIHPIAPGFCLFARRSKHEEIHGFDESVVFAEDTDYVIRGGKIGRFGFLRSVKIPVSVRRMDRDGRLNIAVKYALAEAHILTLGPIRTDIFHYTFGHKQ